MGKNILCLSLAIIVVVSVAGCATIFKQKSRTVNFDSEPQGATVYINGNRMGKTPMPLNLSNKKSVTVTFKKEGYEDKTYIINTKTGTGWVILDIFGGFIPVIIDAVTENWYNLDTDAVKVMLDVERK
ncbi:MAG: PEGA domain-containing protein [Candidatus Omnitrophota bacterium]